MVFCCTTTELALLMCSPYPSPVMVLPTAVTICAGPILATPVNPPLRMLLMRWIELSEEARSGTVAEGMVILFFSTRAVSASTQTPYIDPVIADMLLLTSDAVPNLVWTSTTLADPLADVIELPIIPISSCAVM